MSRAAERALVAAGALAGLAGVGLAAVAAHATGPGNLDTASRFLMVHAPTLIGGATLTRLGLVHRRLAVAASAAIALGLVLFCGDLSLRALYGIAPLRLAAPIGGVLLMAGWAGLGVAALIARRDGGGPA